MEGSVLSFLKAQMWKLLPPGIGLVDFLTPEQGRMPVHVFINGPAKHYLHSFSKLLGQMNRNSVGSTCIKFPQSRMKDERHSI
jgi:hypothetical protein